ncbi:MAG: C40 family peptidase [Bacteroidota bacterium]
MSDTPKGVCRLSVVPVRQAPQESAEQITQLLFGEHYEVLEADASEEWYRIRMIWDEYEGWINHLQHHAIPQEYFEQINAADYKICLDVTASLLFRKVPTPILIGSVLPLSPNELFQMEEQLAFNGDSKSLSQRRDVEFLKQMATRYLGAPYLWGGKSPFGIDCSGFTQMVFKLTGYNLHRDSYQQAEQGLAVDNFSDIEVGDLVFFTKNGLKISHVGITFNKNQIIHASGRVRIDSLTEEGIAHAESGKITHQLHSIRRILKEP